MWMDVQVVRWNCLTAGDCILMNKSSHSYGYFEVFQGIKSILLFYFY